MAMQTAETLERSPTHPHPRSGRWPAGSTRPHRLWLPRVDPVPRALVPRQISKRRLITSMRPCRSSLCLRACSTSRGLHFGLGKPRRAGNLSRELGVAGGLRAVQLDVRLAYTSAFIPSLALAACLTSARWRCRQSAELSPLSVDDSLPAS
eukprot:scaffold26606_cov124-Isochrysis_galbana.AAC.1